VAAEEADGVVEGEDKVGKITEEGEAEDMVTKSGNDDTVLRTSSILLLQVPGFIKAPA